MPRDSKFLERSTSRKHVQLNRNNGLTLETIGLSESINPMRKHPIGANDIFVLLLKVHICNETFFFCGILKEFRSPV